MNTGDSEVHQSEEEELAAVERPRNHISLGHRPFSLSRHRSPDHLLVLKNISGVGGDEDGGDFRMFNIYSSKNDGWSAEDLCPPFMENHPRVVSVCQGIVCLAYSLAGAAVADDGQYLFWNPLTQRYKVIPSPHIPFPRCSCVNDDDHDTSCTSVAVRAGSDLGFEPRSGDYKILIFSSIVYSGEDHYIHSSFPQISLYSLKENSWKEIKNSKYANVDICGDSVCLDGVLYFKCYEEDYVVAFDLALEEFSTLPFPDVLLSRDSRTFLVEFNGSLAFVVSTFSGAAKCFRIWIMDVVDGVRVWVKKRELNMSGFGAKTPLGSCNNGRSFFLQGRDGTLFEYDYLTRGMKSIQQFFGYPPALSRLFSYVESTVELC